MNYDKILTHDVFATRIIKIDCSMDFDAQDISSMINDIEVIIKEMTLMQINEFTPQHQCKPVLFNPDYVQADHWTKLAKTFAECCYIYSHSTPEFVKRPQNLELTGMRAWFYKSYRSLNITQPNPWHDHSPSFLSGVFYLKIPGDHQQGGGTQFQDPRGAGCNINRDVVMLPTELSWVIFPGWMSHRSDLCDTEDPRYVIAADCYVKVR